MENYRKGSNIEEELTKDKIPIECLTENFLWMHVKGGTKVQNVIEFARKALDANEHRAIVWSGSGGGVNKTISCAEVMKRHYKLHQVTRLCFQKVEEKWEPLMEGLEEIVVKRHIPAIHILMSLDELDPQTVGHQMSGQTTSLSFKPKARKEKPFNIQNKRNPRPKNGKYDRKPKAENKES